MVQDYEPNDIDDGFLRQGHAVCWPKPYPHATLSKAVRDRLDKS